MTSASVSSFTATLWCEAQFVTNGFGLSVANSMNISQSQLRPACWSECLRLRYVPRSYLLIIFKHTKYTPVAECTNGGVYTGNAPSSTPCGKNLLSVQNLADLAGHLFDGGHSINAFQDTMFGIVWPAPEPYQRNRLRGALPQSPDCRPCGG